MSLFILFMYTISYFLTADAINTSSQVFTNLFKLQTMYLISGNQKLIVKIVSKLVTITNET